MFARKLKFEGPARAERALFPAAILTSITLVALLIGLLAARDRVNREQARVESQAVAAALDSARVDFAEQTRAYAEHLPGALIVARAKDAGPARLAGPRGETYIVDLARDFSPAAEGIDTNLAGLLAATAPLAADLAQGRQLRGPLSDTARATAWGALRNAVVMASGRPYFASLVPYLDTPGALVSDAHGALPANAPDASLALLCVQPIDPEALARLARAADTQRIDVLALAASGDLATASLATASDGRPYALAWQARRPGDSLVDRNATLLLLFAAIFAALTAAHSRRVTEEAVKGEERALAAIGQDALTGLPNRALFLRLLVGEIERIKRSANERGAAVLFFDCDRFKEINDSAGREAGDRLLVELTQRINGILRSAGRLARLDSDEFAIIQTDVVGPRDAEMLAHRIVEAFAEPFQIDDRQIYVSLSIGVVLCPHDADTAPELMRRADLALYRAKNEGRNRFCFYEQTMSEQLRLRKAVEDDLRLAIEAGGLLLQYQPVMEISGKRMVGVEALVRWPHPVHGLISPASFITLAEECGLILPLGDWVLRRALADMQKWPGLKVAVNVSAIQFRQKEFVASIQALLDETGVDPGRLELELTESVLIADADAAEEAMIELRAMGVRLALDDFGTGYSSLIYLRRFAFDKIKIDKSFLDSVEATGESAIIVHSIVHLGRALGLTVTAEGVETSDQHRFLQALGCHELQGYLFSRPVGAIDISKRLKGQSAPLEESPRAVA